MVWRIVWRAMKTVDFYSLPRGVQDRLLASFRGTFDPKPIIGQQGIRAIVSTRLMLSGVAAVLLAVLCGAGYGSLKSGLSNHHIALIAVYVALAAVTAFGVVRALAYQAIVRALPFAAGVYVFPTELIDARGPRLRVYPLAGLSDVTSAGSSISLRFGVSKFTFPVDPSQRERVLQDIATWRQRVSGPLDEAELLLLDPLVPPIVANPLGTGVTLASKAPAWIRFRWPIVALLSLIGLPLFFLRNGRSDERMFATAKTRNVVEAYKSYLERGDSHRDEVLKVLLPRAELAFALAEGTVEAVDAFVKAYPDTDIQQEVDVARKAALVKAFEKARAVGTLDALTAFDKKHPKHHVKPHLDKATHAVYVKALADFRKKGAKGSTVSLVERLVALAEKSGAKRSAKGLVGTKVEVRIRRVPSKSLDKADILVRRNPYYRGDPSLPSRYFDEAARGPREKRAAASMAKALAVGFKPEVVVFAPGQPIDGSKDQPSVKVPTLIWSYRLEASGAAYASKKPRGIFLGLVFFFHLELLLPGDDDPLVTKHTFPVRIPVKLLKKPKPEGDSTREATLYGTMVETAFAELQKRYLEDWYR
jgi:hypothetical protein